MRFIFLFFNIYSTLGESATRTGKVCKKGTEQNPVDQNLFIVTCDHDGFHIIVEENCRQSDFNNINFKENVYISTKDKTVDGETISDIPPKPDSAAGVCKPDGKTKSYSYAGDDGNAVEASDVTVWAMDFGYEECGEIEAEEISTGEGEETKKYFQYTVYLTEVETLNEEDTTQILVDKTKIQCLVPEYITMEGTQIQVQDNETPTISTTIDPTQITLNAPDEQLLGRIIELALDADEKLGFRLNIFNS